LADIFFSAEDYTNMSYYNCFGIRPKHGNISKRVEEGVITILNCNRGCSGSQKVGARKIARCQF
jgi:hypothetical protein